MLEICLKNRSARQLLFRAMTLFCCRATIDDFDQ
jgi:hypothetical protein